jgi:putative LysE/RhtB family amino acid efflux pump
MRAAITGFGLGFVVAAQIGPLSLFLIRSTLRSSLRVGVAIAAGIAAIDTLYASVGAAGAAPALSIGTARTILGVAGAAILVVLGGRTLWTARRVRAGFETPGEAIAPRRAFLTTLAATASNPLTIASWAAIFAAANGGHASPSFGATLTLLAGIGAGSMCAASALAVAVALLRRRLGARALRAVDVSSGAALIGFGGALGYRTLHE